MHRYLWRAAGVAFLALGVATACQAGATPPVINQQQAPQQRVYPSPAVSPTPPLPTPTVIYLTPPRR
ncbi:MAG: hypothetical protein KatS3mg060_0997 [Dehalococcoidia bacterium]|nr:MAG: hypothetical protein KatS3mg060_0997 [Dehalococcoidia bacterium]